LVTTPRPDERTHRTRVLYISPLRALAFDIEKNLRAPLTGIGLAAERIGVPFVAPEVAMRTGDTPSNDRQKLIRRPPDLLITTPESLYLMLTSSARETLQGVETVIIDEIHAMATTKRGAHLALSLERLEEVTDRPPQRIGLSATQRPLEETARFLGGYAPISTADADTPRPVRIVDTGTRKQLEIDVVVPVEDMSQPGDDTAPVGQPGSGERRSSIWPSIYPKVLELVLAHRSTIIFCNARRAAERLAAKLNELYEETAGEQEVELVRAHHGSLAREQRIVIEDQLKRGELRGDRRHVVARARHRHGRGRPRDPGRVAGSVAAACSASGAPGTGRRAEQGQDLPEAPWRPHRGGGRRAPDARRRDRALPLPRNPLDVLAQQIVAHTAPPATGRSPSWPRSSAVRQLPRADRRAARQRARPARRPLPERGVQRAAPRIVWDRVNDVIRARDGRQAARGHQRRHDPRPRAVRRVPPRRHPGRRARRGDGLREPAGRDVRARRVHLADRGHLLRTGHRHPGPGRARQDAVLARRPPGPAARARSRARRVPPRDPGARPDDATPGWASDYALDEFAAGNVVQYLREQVEATGALPDDRTIVVERFRDEIGDWRVCVLSPFGTPVHAPWAMAIERRLIDRYDLPVETMWGDDGIVIRLPEAADHLDADVFLIEPSEIDELVVSSLPGTSLFSARFRECAGRALLLPRRRPDRAPRCGSSASGPPTCSRSRRSTRRSRSCSRRRASACRTCSTCRRSRGARPAAVPAGPARAGRHAVGVPMASSLLFNWIAQYMYEGDAPLAERRAAALSLDRDLLRELLGAEELRELLDPGCSPTSSSSCSASPTVGGRGRRRRAPRRAPQGRRPHRRRGRPPLRRRRLGLARHAARRAAGDRDRHRQRRPVRRGRGRGEVPRRARLLVAARAPDGVHRAGAPSARGARRSVRPHARSVPGRRRRPPVLAPDRAVDGAIAALAADDRLVRGEFRPDGVQREWCDVDVLRQLRRRSLATLRREVEPVEPDALARFVPAWHGIPAERRGPDALVDAIGLLAGAPIVASTLERDVLPARLAPYRPNQLDELCAAGEVVWTGAGSIGARDGRIRLCFADQLSLLAPGWAEVDRPDGERHDAIRELLGTQGASFWGQLRAADPEATDTELLVALWDLVWAGEVTNDTLAPLRAVLAGGGVAPKRRSSAGDRAPGPDPADSPGSARRRGRPLEPAVARTGRRPPRRRTPRRCSCSNGTAC
jgi:ATP-dependent helicase Lhr and Lhr-like helicase